MAPTKRKASRAATGQHPAGQDSDDEESPARLTKKQRPRKENPASATIQDAESLPADADAGNADATSAGGVEAKPLDGKQAVKTNTTGKKGLDARLPPITDVREMMEDMVERFDPAALKGTDCTLKVATVCSGTEAPLFALNMIRDALQTKGSGNVFNVEHKFSCEIEPYKQGFINRNTPPGTLIFRDVVEMAAAAPAGKATTASGSKVAIPKERLDILFAGCSCVDYSALNTSKPSERVPTLDRHLKQNPEELKENGKDDDECVPPNLDEQFVKDLDIGIEELRNTPLGGESDRTFFAAVKLMTVNRPRMIIVENVVHAPWKMYTKRIFPKIGYVAGRATVDSKNYYLPQTRRRIYLIAIDPDGIGELAARAIIKNWKDFLNQCARQASAPISAFLLPNDDPAIIQARADMESKPPSKSDWSLSSLRHSDARKTRNIRQDDNLFSNKAMRNGKPIHAVFPGRSWRTYWENQMPRVIDSMDITSAMTNQVYIDLGHKIIMIDVSQNVDRSDLYDDDVRRRVRNHLGIIGCITPSGMPVVTHLMRPITGTETLTLQGLPIGELILSTESEKDLRDLAGNAMTVPVVGAVTLALLEAVALAGLLSQPEPASPSRELRLEAPRDEVLEPGVVNNTTTDLAPLLAKVKVMVRQCYCQTRPSEILVCRDCGVTACSACRGNPVHRFGPKTATSLEFTPEEGKAQLNDMLPNALKLPVPAFVVNYALNSVKEELYRTVVRDILDEEGEHVYYFDTIMVTEVVTVCYKAINSIAHLVLAPEGPCSWYIYIAPWHPQRAELFQIVDFDQPIARGQLVEADNISFPQWSVWAQGRIDLELMFANTENNNLIPSYLSFAPQYSTMLTPSLQAWKTLVEKKVYGTYLHHPDCGTAGKRLHINQSSTPDNSVFMMWDSGLLRDPDEDHFVWTETARTMEPHEYREILLHAQPTPTWELNYSINKPMRAFWPGYWSRPSECSGSLDIPMSIPSQDIGQVHWGFVEAIQQAPCHTDGEAPIIHMPALAVITAPFREFPRMETQLTRIFSHQTDDKFSIIPTTRREPFLRKFAFLSSMLRRSTRPVNLVSFPHLEREWVTISACRDCSVVPPEITVYTKQDEEEKKKKMTAKDSKTIIEDPDEAALFERKFQDLPRAVAITTRFLQGGEGHVTMDMRVLFQSKTLASRALAYLLQAHRTAARGRSAVNSDAVTSFMVELDYASASMTDFAPFITFVRPCSEENTVGIDTTSEYELPDAGPPRMTRLGHKLRTSQKEAVDWMLRRERAPLGFVKSEVEEEIVSPLNLRVLGKAEWTTHFPFSSRGGVIAHEIGYGKTVVTLALIDHMRDFDKKESIDERREKVDAAWAEELSHDFQPSKEHDLSDLDHPDAPFFCHLSATLVVVPKHITGQWSDEAKKFLGLAAPKLLAIDSTAAFYGKYTLDQLKQAEVIIVSSAVFTAGFMKRLEGVAGSSDDGLSGRTLEAWYRGAMRNHRILTAHYLAGRAANSSHEELLAKIEKEVLPGLIKKQEAAVAAVAEKQVVQIDRGFYKRGGKGAEGPAGAADLGEDKADVVPENKQRRASKGKGGKNAAKGSWDITSLHNFSFARLVWDECSCYGEGAIGLFVANAVANAKWPISATPKLFGLEEVCKMAAALGIHVARPEPRMLPGLPPVTRGVSVELSQSEKFHVYSSVPKSAALAHHRHDRAALFLGAHLRGNPLDPEINIRFREHVVPVEMTTSDSIRYHVVNQEVLDSGFDYTALPAHIRDVVALKGSDLLGIDGTAASRMLLGVVACGLCKPHALTQAGDFADRSAKLSDQMKLLWDKMLWLWRWLLPFGTEQTKESAVNSTLKRVETMCADMYKALLGPEGDFEEFGGLEMYQLEAAVVAGLPITAADARPNINTIRALVGKHFLGDWAQTYCRDKALNTWVDFFQMDDEDVNRLTQDQLLLLATDICWLKYKVIPNAAPFRGGHLDQPLLEKTLAATHQNIPRTIPADIEAQSRMDMAYLASLEKDELRDFIQVCITIMPKPPTWEEAKGSFQAPVRGRTALQECLTGHNVRFTSAHTIDQLKEKLWQHQNGLGISDLYRDSRTPPNKHRAFSAATSCNGGKAAQVAAANSELKYTMVHIAKTVEDLRATRLEAKFLPGYTSQANAEDPDAVVRDKRCGGCSQPLASAETSFLIVGCGHFMCSGCRSAATSYCPAQDCLAFILKRPVLRCSEIPPAPQGEPLAKPERVAELIKERIPREDFVVVFAQYRLVIAALGKAFESAGLTFLDLSGVRDGAISAKLEAFKAGKAGQILILDIDSETSAGSNLTIANHVIFANPYVHPDRAHQARTVRQARGRCIRHPQPKEVQVYHFMAKGTIEEEMLRKISKDSPAVEAFLADYPRPWWFGEDDE